MSDPSLLYLDNNIYNLLVDRPDGPLTVDLLIDAYRSGAIQVVGTLSLEEELLAAARRRPNKYASMRRIYNRVTGDRILLPLNLRHTAEAHHGGRLPVTSRYIGKNRQQKLRTQAVDRKAIRELGELIYDRKSTQHERQRTRFAAATAKLATLPGKPSLAVRTWHASFDPTTWLDDVVQTGVESGAIPSIEPADVGYTTLPSAWLTAAFWAVKHKRRQTDNRKIQLSDTHDSEHVAAGAYYDIFVTEDTELRDALAEIKQLPFNVMTPEEFATALRTRLARDH